jgi:hypothetical protein
MQLARVRCVVCNPQHQDQCHGRQTRDALRWRACTCSQTEALIVVGPRRPESSGVQRLVALDDDTSSELALSTVSSYGQRDPSVFYIRAFAAALCADLVCLHGKNERCPFALLKQRARSIETTVNCKRAITEVGVFRRPCVLLAKKPLISREFCCAYRLCMSIPNILASAFMRTRNSFVGVVLQTSLYYCIALRNRIALLSTVRQRPVVKMILKLKLAVRQKKSIVSRI